MKVKTHVPEKRRGVVYEVPCKDCSKAYVGEMKRTLKVSLGEHRQALKRGVRKNGVVCMPLTPSMQLIGPGKSEEDGS